MSFLELLVIAAGLSMDAFAASVCKGLASGRVGVRHMATVGMWFGGFQALMPLLGFMFGSALQSCIAAFDHWIAFVLLSFTGANMIKSAVSGDEDCSGASFAAKTMLILAVATSIDALAAGITFAFLNVNIIPAVTITGAATFLLSAVGIKIGSVFGQRCKSTAEITGGAVLILTGLKILLEHTGILII